MQGDGLAAKRSFSSKVKPKKKTDVAEMGLLKKKVKILADGIQVNMSEICVYLLFRLWSHWGES